MGSAMTKQTPVAILGANGYSGEELVRLVLGHPMLRLTAVTSRQQSGRTLSSVFPRFAGLPGSEVTFIAPEVAELLSTDAEWFFLALPHGVSSAFAVPLRQAGRKIIDISADFRLRDAGTYQEFYKEQHPAPELLSEAVYGLPERHREAIRTASLIAAPGCYPTSILLPLLPLLEKGLLDSRELFVSSCSGTSGAGRKADETLLFAECSGSLRAYGLPKHRHLSEIEQELSAASGHPVVLTFVPHLAPMIRGIHTTICAKPAPGITQQHLLECWHAAYANEPFVRVRTEPPDVKHVAGTNFCDISLSMDTRTGRVVLLSAEDNLIKGAGGQAVQCLNIALGLPETSGLL